MPSRTLPALLCLFALAVPAGPPINQAVSTWHGAEVHLLTLAPGTRLTPAVARPGQTLEKFVRAAHAQAGINGGYFNHSDGWPVSHVSAAGKSLTNPESNPALLRNAVLKPHLPTILAHRSEWRHVTAGRGETWRIAFHDAAIAPQEQLLAALQAGPRLLPTLELEAEAFVIRDTQGRVVRDGIGSSSRATRSALGLCADGRLLLVSVGAPGLTLAELAKLMAHAGAVEALNLDGGSSTGLIWSEGGKLKSFHGGHASAPLNSVLLVGP